MKRPVTRRRRRAAGSGLCFLRWKARQAGVDPTDISTGKIPASMAAALGNPYDFSRASTFHWRMSWEMGAGGQEREEVE